MSDPSPDPLRRVARAVADGRTVDWQREAEQHPELRADLDALRIVEHVGRVLGDEASDPSDSIGGFGAFGADLAGRYTLDRVIGRGGMATVLLANDLKHGRRVAIKVMHPHVGAAVGLNPFRREIEMAARLTHPHIVPLHDSGQAAGQLYYVMPYIDGESLRARLRREGRLPIAEALRLAGEIASGLGHAHQHGLVHRDVKPENVLLADGIALVTDFGIARVAEPGLLDSHSTIGPGVGTPAYMAPEQVIGGSIDARTDVYALGCVIFEMLTGHAPFQGEPERLRALHASAEAPSPGAERPEIPAHVDATVVRALAKAREDRPASMTEFARSLAGHAGSDALPAPRAAGDESRGPTRRKTLTRVAAGAGVLAVAGILVWLATVTPWRGSAAGGIRSLAVLPLENQSGDASQDYFADGVTEELINHLSQIGVLRVISRTSSMTFKGSRLPIARIADRLHVDAVVEGSVARAGDRVRLTTELVQATPERELWSRSLERQVRDVLALPGELAGSIADELRVRLTPRQRTRLTHSPAVDPDAHDAYLRGRSSLATRDEASFRSALGYFQRAVQIDSTYAQGWAGIGDAYYELSNAYLPPRAAMPLARAACLRALALDPDLAEAHATYGVVAYAYDWDWAPAERELKRSLELNPNLDQAHVYYGYLLEATGRFDAAIAQLKAAAALNPLSGQAAAEAGWSLYLAGRYDEALALWHRQLEIDPDSQVLLYNIGMTLEAQGRYPEAIAMLRKAVAKADFSFPLGLLCHAYGRAGRRAEALATLNRLRHLPEHVSAINYAFAYEGLGDKTEAFRWLNQAFDNRDEDLTMIKVDPKFSTLRSDPRFADLLRRMNLAS